MANKPNSEHEQNTELGRHNEELLVKLEEKNKMIQQKDSEIKEKELFLMKEKDKKIFFRRFFFLLLFFFCQPLFPLLFNYIIAIIINNKK